MLKISVLWPGWRNASAMIELKISDLSFRNEKILKRLEPEDGFILTFAAAAAAAAGQSRLPQRIISVWGHHS